MAENISPVMIGRESALSTLGQALHAAQQGQGQCLLIVGEAGIGKSRLVAELCSRAVAEQFLIWEGHCFEQDLSFPYAPWIDALRAFLAPKSSTETGELLGALASELIKVLPELSLLIPDLRPNPPLDAESEKRRLFETVARLGAQLAKTQPLLVVLEDVHWSDEASLELLHFCARRFGPLPLLLVVSYRSDEVSPWLLYSLAALNRDRLVRELRLGPLARHEVEQLARAILKPEHTVTAERWERFISLTEGNPFFVEEMLKSLIQAGELDNLPVPHGIQDFVQRRVEQLPESTRQVLTLASVIGERFDFGLLQEIAAQDEPSLLRMLKALITAHLIVEQSADQFVFRHALTRHAVYATLLLRERQALHQRIGETIEGCVGARTDVSVAQLAYHFYQAGVWQKAMLYSQRAGEQAQALYAPREAVVHFTHAIEAAVPLGIPTPLSPLRGRAHAREVLGDFEGARADEEAILELARQGTNRGDEWQSLIDLGFLLQSCDLARAGECYQHALEMARTLGEASLVAQSLNRVGNWQMNCGRALEALPFHLEALSLFQKLNDRHGMARTMDLLALVSFQLGDVLQGTAYLEQALPILRDVDDRQTLVNTLTNLAGLAHFETEVLGELNYQHLADLSEEALQIAHGFHWSQGEVRALIPGAIAVMRGAEACGGFISLSDAESYAVEYWPLEQYKLRLSPPEREFARHVVLVTGAAGGIGSAICRRVAQDGAHIVATDIDLAGAEQLATYLNQQFGSGRAVAVRMDVTSEESVRAAFEQAALAFGGLDVIVNNAGLASSAPITGTSLAEWNKNWNVLATGYFLVSREGFRLLQAQGRGGNLVFIASKNALVAGKNAAAYSTAKAAEAHLARCLAEEGGQFGIRVNTVNPDAVLAGSRIWDSAWRQERAATYGVAPDQLEEVYRKRTTLLVNILPEDIAEAVAFFASPTRSTKSTGNILNVDGGVAAAYPR